MTFISLQMCCINVVRTHVGNMPKGIETVEIILWKFRLKIKELCVLNQWKSLRGTLFVEI